MALLVLTLAAPVGPGFAQSDDGCHGDHGSMHEVADSHGMSCCDTDCGDEDPCGDDCPLGHTGSAWAVLADLSPLHRQGLAADMERIDGTIAPGILTLPLRPPISS